MPRTPWHRMRKQKGKFLAKGQPAPLRESETSLCPATALVVQGPNRRQEELVPGLVQQVPSDVYPLLAPQSAPGEPVQSGRSRLCRADLHISSTFAFRMSSWCLTLATVAVLFPSYRQHNRSERPSLAPYGTSTCSTGSGGVARPLESRPGCPLQREVGRRGS